MTLARIRLLAFSSGDEWSPHALELLGDASALARRIGARVDAWVLPPLPTRAKLDELAGFGCHAVTVLEHERLLGWSSEIVATALAASLGTDCRLILLPAGARGEEVAGLLAGKLEIDWVADVVTLGATRSGDLELVAALASGRLSRGFRATGPVIATMREGVAEIRREATPAPLEVLHAPVDLAGASVQTVTGQFLPADPSTQDITHARRIVAGGRGTGGPVGMALVSQLTEALDASLAASRVAVDLGWAPPERQVGQTGRTVRPDLYVACGISGATHHLAGMRDSRHIIAINPDPTAPIHELAHLSLEGDLQAVIPAIHDVLERRRQGAGPT